MEGCTALSAILVMDGLLENASTRHLTVNKESSGLECIWSMTANGQQVNVSVGPTRHAPILYQKGRFWL